MLVKSCLVVLHQNVFMMNSLLNSVVCFLFQVTPEEARDSWENQFTFSFKKCSHANW